MKTSDFDYTLPPELIAQQPLAQRDAARMLVLDRVRRTMEHRNFADFPACLRTGDLLVLNDTKVIPARLIGRKPSGGQIELLLVEELSSLRWLALTRPAKRLREGMELVFETPPHTGERKQSAVPNAASTPLRALIETKRDAGEVIVRFSGTENLMADLDRFGHTPLPPYIRRGEDEPADRERYQTVFADHAGAIAAPTAGLHFTPRTFEELARRGVHVQRLTLHVGLGTFKPVTVEDIEQHTMHVEHFDIPSDTAQAVNAAKREGRRVVCVGTTTLRALESVADSEGQVRAGAGETDIFIHPPHKFRVADALLTNFHLPRSTLLMLVCAFAGRDLVLRAYEEATQERYRFYSYGDCMLIV
jgi:S-adenosylmethionine:tRNA ribosyltransferase-isomerase